MNRSELLAKLAHSICNLKKNGPVLVGIDGVDGAGKTTLADELVPIIEARGCKVARASIDGFHNPREKRIEKGALSPEGYFSDSFDYNFLTSQFLELLNNVNEKLVLRSAKHDWKTETKVDDKSVEIDPSTIVLFEGVFLYREELEKYWDYKIYVQIDPDKSLERGIVRDSHLLGGVEATKEKYLKRYIPGQKIYHDKYQPHLRANLVIKNDDPMNPEVVREA